MSLHVIHDVIQGDGRTTWEGTLLPVEERLVNAAALADAAMSTPLSCRRSTKILDRRVASAPVQNVIVAGRVEACCLRLRVPPASLLVATVAPTVDPTQDRVERPSYTCS
ncbi:hypothetical protein BHE74_00037980 [Ensete ventricosum]|nr:hypothetical protein GW17_00040335 [Ensete ventricosum]RWW55391.1 hypothetical protein BHE74_00037980 [Ensete ventricosum]